MGNIANKVIKDELNKLDEKERQLVLVWSQEALKIADDKALSVPQKIKKLSMLEAKPFLGIFFERLLSIAKTQLWDKRGWPARLTIAGLALGVSVSGTQAAGIAAFGSAVGINIFVLTAAGGALLGTVIQELTKDRSEK